MEKPSWHTLSIKEILRILNTREEGISQLEAKRRLEDYGLNELKKEKKISPVQLFFNQFKSFLIIVLIIAAILSLVLGKFVDGTMILIIVLLNAILGFVQEYRAGKAIEALKKMTALHAIVLRNGIHEEILSKDVVPGDIIFIEEGRQVPADARLIKSYDLYADESALTGESLPVLKETVVIKKDVPVAEMKNTIFMSTNITRGNAVAVVTGTSANTEIGKIAKIVQEETKEISPLQQRLEKLGQKLTIAIIILSAIVFMIGLYEGTASVFNLFLVAVALAVSAIPEALPAVITLTLAMGMQTMAKNNAIVKRLLAVETLGTTSVICSDKTGTLTKNEMTVRKIFADNKFVEVSGEGYDPIGNFTIEGKYSDLKKEKVLNLLLETGYLCNNAEINKVDKEWKLIGDPTEGALVVAAEKAKIKPSKEDFVLEIPFTSERKSMSVVYKRKGKNISYVKGAPERIINESSRIIIDGKVSKLTKKQRDDLQEISRRMAGEPLRVLAIAYKELPKKKKYTLEDTESDLIFLGFAGLVDPPRMEVKDAITVAHKAGIKTVMITGDHKTTAVAIAKQIGILGKEDIAVTGIELDAMSDKELDEIIENVSVFARVSPEHKVKILDAFKRVEHVVAMTGDGVNDAPAIKRSDIGIAMGIKGTDVTKEASDMILQDDNYATIVKAVKEGRGIYDNIRKFIKLMLSMNFTELFLVAAAALAKLPLPLLPLQILWINLATDSLPSLALAVDTKDSDIMKRKPRKKKESIFSGGILYFIIVAAAMVTFVEIGLFLFGLNVNIEYARTMVFTLSVMFEMVFVFNCRSETRSVFRVNPFSNKKLILAVMITICLQVMVIYVPFFQGIFHTVALSMRDWLLIITLSLIGLIISPLFFKKPEKNAATT